MDDKTNKPNYKAVGLAIGLLVHVMAYTNPMPWPLIMGLIDAVLVYLIVWPRLKKYIGKK